MKYHSFTPNIVAYLFLALVAVVSVTIFLALVNDVMATKTVLETSSGQKSICTRFQYNYSLKSTQCAERVLVAATCKKVESVGPIFDPIITTTCE